MSKNIIIDPGILPVLKLKNSFEEFSKINKITLITEKRRKESILDINFSFEVIFYENFQKCENNKLNTIFSKKYTKALQNVLNDQRTFLIAERVNYIFAWNSLFSITSTIEKIVFNTLIYYQEYETDSLLFQATPHNLTNWVMAKVAESVGISVKMIQSSPLPWRYWIVEGLDVQKPVFPTIEENLSNYDNNLLKDYIKLNKEDYDRALPEYEKKRLDSRKGKIWSWSKEIKNASKHPKFAINLPTKRKLFKLYKKLSVYPDLNTKYLVFFMHFQPERTSMPEAYDFSNQWFIIRMLSQSLPKGWKLVVKEHPSIFINQLDFRYRNSKFYKNIDAIDNVELASLYCDTFDLIDYSQAIVTITGTVGVQALIRNKPVLVFGVASYRNQPNVYSIRELSDLEEAIEDIKNTGSENQLEWLLDINSMSVSGITPENIGNGDNFYKPEYRVNGHLILITNFLKKNYK